MPDPWKHALSEKRRQVERAKPLTDRVQNRLAFVAWLLPETTDWLVAKKQLMLELTPAERQLFSTRDPITKKHYGFNQFEQQVRQAWLHLTGNMLLMPADKMLEPPEAYEP